MSYLDENQLNKLVTDTDKPYVLLNFYNTSCKPCTKEIPELKELIHHPHAHLDVHFIALQDENSSENELALFWKKLKMTTPIYSVKTESLDTFLQENRLPIQTNKLPLSLILSNDGRLVKGISTFTDAHEVSMIIHRDESFGN